MSLQPHMHDNGTGHGVPPAPAATTTTGASIHPHYPLQTAGTNTDREQSQLQAHVAQHANKICSYFATGSDSDWLILQSSIQGSIVGTGTAPTTPHSEPPPPHSLTHSDGDSECDQRQLLQQSLADSNHTAQSDSSRRSSDGAASRSGRSPSSIGIDAHLDTSDSLALYSNLKEAPHGLWQDRAERITSWLSQVTQSDPSVLLHISDLSTLNLAVMSSRWSASTALTRSYLIESLAYMQSLVSQAMAKYWSHCSTAPTGTAGPRLVRSWTADQRKTELSDHRKS